MYRKAIEYKRPNGQVTFLAPGSTALLLYEQKRLIDLNKHLKQLDENERQLLERYK